jgi:hypothetical protein
LNPYGVHLINKQGTIALAKNFTDFLKASYWLSINNSRTVEYENGNNVHRKTPLPNTAFLLPKLRGFRIAHLNIGSLIKHFDELLIYMHDKPFDILTLNETRLDNDNDNELHLYSAFFIWICSSALLTVVDKYTNYKC